MGPRWGWPGLIKGSWLGGAEGEGLSSVWQKLNIQTLVV